MDGLIRIVLWGAALLVLVPQFSENGAAPPTRYILPLAAVIAALACDLLFSIPSVAHRLRRESGQSAILMTIVPLAVIVPYALVARQDPDFDPSVLLSTAMLLFLPVACALLNTPALRGGDVVIGLVTAFLPLAAPLIRNEAISTLGVWMRLGALALPVLLLLLTTREQKQRLNFLFICAVFSLWYSVEFRAFPDYLILDGAFGTGPVAGLFAGAFTNGLQYFDVMALPLLLFVLALANRFAPLGLSFRPSVRGAGTVLVYAVVTLAVLVGLGLIAGVLHWDSGELSVLLSDGPSSIAGAFLRLFGIYLFVALPEEILFRGALLTYLRDVLAWPVGQAMAISSLVFGLAHLNQFGDVLPVPDLLWIVVLAAVAGVCYALTFVARKNVAASAAVHALVNWLGGMVTRL